MDEYNITNDQLYSEVEAGIDRIKDRIIEELLMSNDKKDIDEILDDVQTAMVSAKKEKKIYRSWIFEQKIPDEFIYEPDGEEIIENEEED